MAKGKQAQGKKTKGKKAKGKSGKGKKPGQKPKGKFQTKAAIYAYDDYPQNFSSYWFGGQTLPNKPYPQVVLSVQNIRKHFNYGPNDIVEWGTYQKYAPDDPEAQGNWGEHTSSAARDLYQNWESAIDEAREDLAKLPIDTSVDGPDPDNPDGPNSRGKNMLDELDAAVTIALLKKYMTGMTGSYTGVPIEVSVDFQPVNWRRHKVVTKWHKRPLSLEIKMTCPSGGWVGTALWKKYNHYQLGKVTEFRAQVTVPDQPENHGQILFIFNGLESIPSLTDAPAILQPVLQWTNENGGTWALRSWYVPASYTPSFDQMPKIADYLPFKDPLTPAWTAATPVNVGDTVEGIIQWDDTKYVSSFVRNGQEIARLEVPGIADLTYPVAVVEAYMTMDKGRPRPKRVPKSGLVDFDMKKISITTQVSNAPVTPDWDVGKEDPSNPKVHYGTNRLKLYKVRANYGGAPITTLSFKAK